MKLHRNIKLLSIMTISFLLHACGIAHVKTEVVAQDIDQYTNIFIQDVRVYSNEASAKNNVPLQEKLKSWESYSRGQIESYINASKFTLVKSLDDTKSDTLLIDLDVNVKYGNRALRWAVGFGAGGGGVDSTLTVKDAKTGEVKYRGHADSDLSVGIAGGDIGDVLEKNIRELMKAIYSGV